VNNQRHISPMICLAAIALLGLAASTHAAMFTNGDFEAGTTGWTLSGNVGVQTNVDRSYDGTKSVSYNGGNALPTGVVSQSFDTVVGAEYKLTFYMVQHGVSSSGHSILDVDVFDGTGFAGTNLLSDQAEVLTGVVFNSQSGTPDGLTPFYDQFMFFFIAQSTTSTLRFSDASTNDGIGFDPYLDSVSLTVIPTPAALPAGLLLMAAMFLRQRR
jgi:hypothetical protein